MAANSARKDGNKKKARKELTHEQIGVLQKRLHEVVRRIEEGQISFEMAAQALQRISEQTFISHYPETKAKESWEIFHRPPEKERRKSLAPYGMVLERSRVRLDFPQRTPELVMAEVWEAENIPKPQNNSGRVPLNTILNVLEVDSRDVRVVGSTVQWLGTNIGMSFYRQFLRAADIRGF